VAAVEVGGVGYVEVPHEFGEVGFRGLHYQMKVVGHQNVGMKPDLVDPEGGLKFLYESLTVRAIAEDFPLFIASAGNVINGVWIINPKRPCHV
jgi:hypothetical protein